MTSSASSSAGFADVAAGEAGQARDAVPDRLDLEVVRAIVVLQEVEAGRLDLDVTRQRSPALARPTASRSDRSRCDHLLTHTAGLAIGTEESPTRSGRGLRSLRALAPTFAAGRTIPVLERRLEARRCGAGGGYRHARPRPDTRACPRVRCRCVDPGRRSPNEDAPGHLGRLRADVRRPSRAPEASARRRPPGSCEHGRRRDHLDRGRHEPLRADAARSRVDPRRRPGGPDALGRDVRADARRCRRRRTTSSTTALRLVAWTYTTGAGGSSSTPAGWSATRPCSRVDADAGTRGLIASERGRQEASGGRAMRSTPSGRACAGEPLPELLPRRHRTAIAGARVAAGTLRGGATADRAARDGEGLRLARRRRSGRARALGRRAGDPSSFRTRRSTASPCGVRRDEDGRVVELVHGPTGSCREGEAPDPPPSPRRGTRYAGPLPLNDPWAPVLPGLPARRAALLACGRARRAARRSAHPNCDDGGSRWATRPLPRRLRFAGTATAARRRRPTTTAVAGTAPSRTSLLPRRRRLGLSSTTGSP